MRTFLPWNEENLQHILETFSQGNMPVLDLEMSALCDHRLSCGGCLYCDSSTGKPHPNELAAEEIETFLIEAKTELGLRWIYCCGLGEPSDDPNFRHLVKLTAENNMLMSFFTNGIHYTTEYLQFLHEHEVSLLIKCDSFNPEVFGKLLGIDSLEVVRSIYQTIDMAIDIGFTEPCATDSTRLALSIVPTQYNRHDVLNVVDFCNKNNIFPLIGQLEYAGRGQEVFDSLALNNNELSEMKGKVEHIIGTSYEIPVCPAGIAGIHITNTGNCVVHQNTGLSCPWFDLSVPKIHTLGNVRETNIKTLWDSVKDYRKSTFHNAQHWLEDLPSDVFGGCGGKHLVEKYLNITQSAT